MRLNIHHFVVTSVLAHAALLAAWVSPPSRHMRIPAADASAPVIQVTLRTQPTRTAAPKPVRHHRHRIKPHRHKMTPRPTPIRTPPAKPIARVAHAPRPSPVTTAQRHHQAQVQRKTIRARVLSRIRTDLQQYFVYPMLAQRRGWQGRVLLAFSVAANGRIRNIHVAAGSGYPVLDSSAVDALARVHHLYSANDGLAGKSLDLQLPVIFQLQGG